MIKMSEARDHVAIGIDNILLDLPSIPTKPSIFRVNDVFFTMVKIKYAR